MHAAELPCRRTVDALLVRVRLTPKGGRDSIDGVVATAEGPALKARVRAAPEEGEANAALVACIAGWLGVARRDVSLASGHRSRTKLLAIAGDPAQLETRFAAALASAAR